MKKITIAILVILTLLLGACNERAMDYPEAAAYAEDITEDEYAPEPTYDIAIDLVYDAVYEDIITLLSKL